MGRIANAAEIVIVTLCLPFYAVAIPLAVAYEWLEQKRSVRLGLEVTHWVASDVREDDHCVGPLSDQTKQPVVIRSRVVPKKAPLRFRDHVACTTAGRAELP